jgi:hypothetical protein
MVVRKKKLSQWAPIYGIAAAVFVSGFTVRFLTPPVWLKLTIYGFFAIPIAWLVCRELLKRRIEKRIDREAAWRAFVRDRDVH